ncbi:hypothetical protein GCM10025868_22220 [Angustibacter aerolatus]|uniref:Rrf2 family transcriptional regulator n=1 Tax=Angustibacter aerolatus TaxID=1162965 RepID=A0ABQ6JJC5_9ACTN|nr:hypothetical protein GCM10025868_22220 [Angustibacter aerolatus]
MQALEGREPAFRCTEIRQCGPLAAPPEACTRPCGVAQAMHAAERAWRDALAATSIADLADGLERTSGPGTLEGVARWLRSDAPAR